jgi:hypothetical protein
MFPRSGQSIVDALTADAHRQIIELRRWNRIAESLI